jgi:RimJ/RimL family protein N-acetyltransferase
MDRIELREFLPQDYDALIGWVFDARELLRFGGPELRWPLDAAQLDTLASDPQRLCWTVVLVGSREPAGHVELMVRGQDSAHMGRVIIDPALRGRGLGSELTRALLAQARARRLHQVTLHVYVDNPPAIAAYERCGFVVDELHPTRPGVQRMVCRL